MIRALSIVLLSTMIFVAYAPVRDARFLNFDDNEYVSANPHVRDGISADGIGWAFTESHSSNWHPVTWIAHMLDAEFFGTGPDDAGGHHLSNVLVHSIASGLLAWLGFVLTGRWWASLLVAALFGLHPVHVESVAWISERKDTLSAALGFATLIAWTGWVRYGGRWRYLLTTVLLALGLMAKPILVTLPVVMLLLEIWPLQRQASWKQRLVEKLPWFGLVVASAVATVFAQSASQAVKSTAAIPMSYRVVNAIHSVLAYLGKIFAPLDLAALYPHWAITPGLRGPSPLQTAIELSVLLLITALAVWFWRSRQNRLPLVAWGLWLLLLAPVIGILQVGDQAMADRYTYLPSIALFALFAGVLASIVESEPGARIPVLGLACLLLVGCGIGTWQRAGVWQDSETLFRDAIAHEPANPNAHLNLGQALAQRGAYEEAGRHYAIAARLRPGNPMAQFNLGNALREQDDLQGAADAYGAALAADPSYAPAASNLGDIQARQGNFEAAIESFRTATQLDPTLKAARINLARALLITGQAGAARDAAYEALKLDPDNPTYRATLEEAEAALASSGDQQ